MWFQKTDLKGCKGWVQPFWYTSWKISHSSPKQPTSFVGWYLQGGHHSPYSCISASSLLQELKLCFCATYEQLRGERQLCLSFYPTHRSYRERRCPIPGSVQGQVGWGFEQPGVVEGVPVHGRGVGTRWSVRSLPTQTIYDPGKWPTDMGWFCSAHPLCRITTFTKAIGQLSPAQIVGKAFLSLQPLPRSLHWTDSHWVQPLLYSSFWCYWEPEQCSSMKSHHA